MDMRTNEFVEWFDFMQQDMTAEQKAISEIQP
jgi:hypothetical protein